MRLKRVKIFGFKTFADRTEIEFGDGLTAVVGPNGCGKSNIADALLWVMGEQNPRENTPAAPPSWRATCCRPSRASWSTSSS